MIAVLTQPEGSVTVTDGTGDNHAIPSFPELQKQVTSMTDDVSGTASEVREIASNVNALANAAQQAAESAAVDAVDAVRSEIVGDVGALVDQAHQTVADVSQALGNNAGFKQKQDGSVLRTYQGKARDAVSVLDFIPAELHDGITEGTNAVDLSPYISTAIAAQAYNATTTSVAGGELYFPPGTYLCGSSIELYSTIRLRGAGVGQNGGYSTKLLFPNNTHGIVVNRYQTGQDGNPRPDRPYGGDGSHITNLYIAGAAKTAGNADGFHGIWMRARAKIENCFIESFSGNGIHIVAQASGGNGITLGNANLWCVDTVRIILCRWNGFFVQGADVNAGVARNLSSSGNGRWGVYDNSFLGNTYVGSHFSTNGYSNNANSGVTSVVYNSGFNYYVVNGQEAAASTTAPGTNPAVWVQFNTASGPTSAYPQWFEGISVVSGGSICTVNANARNVLIGTYHEGGQGEAQINGPTLSLGGILTVSPASKAPHLFTSIFGSEYFITTEKGIGSRKTDSTGRNQSVWVGGNVDNGDIFRISSDTYAPSSWRLKFDTSNNGDLAFNYQNSSAGQPYSITGPATARQFGTGAAVPYAFQTNRLYLGTGDNARLLTYGTSAPTTGAHGRGERVYNLNAAAGGAEGWVCVAAGTPGTWKTFGSIAA